MAEDLAVHNMVATFAYVISFYGKGRRVVRATHKTKSLFVPQIFIELINQTTPSAQIKMFTPLVTKKDGFKEKELSRSQTFMWSRFERQ